MLDIIATLGPASADETILREILDVAAAFRLNAAHLDPAALTAWLTRLASLFSAAGREVPVYVDLSGAKMRIGVYPASDTLPERIRFVSGTASLSAHDVPVPHPVFFEAIRRGDIVTLNDARLAVRILSHDTTSADGEVLRNGPLSSHKGINRVAHPLPYPRLSQADGAVLQAALAFPFTCVAFSFVVDGTEASLLRPVARNRRLAAKIERPEAFGHLENIADAFDEVWLCRGDLGAQAGLRVLGALQDRFVAFGRTQSKPYFLAGQVLEHMTHFPQPTRAEVVGLHAAARDGFAGIVLSDETAIGHDPRAVARFLREMR